MLTTFGYKLTSL